MLDCSCGKGERKGGKGEMVGGRKMDCGKRKLRRGKEQKKMNGEGWVGGKEKIKREEAVRGEGEELNSNGEKGVKRLWGNPQPLFPPGPHPVPPRRDSWSSICHCNLSPILTCSRRWLFTALEFPNPDQSLLPQDRVQAWAWPQRSVKEHSHLSS